MQVLSQYFYKIIHYYMLNKLKTTIAVVDSGIGGTSVLSELIEKYPHYNYLYFADNLNMPYGKKSKRFLLKRAKEIIGVLKNSYKVDAIIIACNTLSSVISICDYENVYVMPFSLDKTYLATPLTKSVLTNHKIIPDVNLATKIEQHIFNKPALNRIIKSHIKRFKLDNLNELVLGCTHYELCYEIFKKNCPNTKISKNSDFLINNLKLDFNLLEEKPSVKIILSKPSKSYSEKIRRLIRR